MNIPDWFSEKGNFDDDVLKKLTGMGGGFDPRSAANVVRDEALEANVKKAAKEVIDEQINLGIDVITDGEVERGSICIITIYHLILITILRFRCLLHAHHEQYSRN